MRRQWTARRLAPLERQHRDRLGCRQLRRGLGLRRILFQVGKLQFELIEQRATLRGLPELFVPQLLDRELELLDQQRPRLGFGFRGQAGGALGAQHCLQGVHIIGERIVGAHRAKRITTRRRCLRTEDSNRRDQPAACGRHVCCGIRQSMPSSR
jgi:hypothetical protein